MLVLSRKPGESILIGDNVRVVVTRVSGDKVSLGIEAPREVPVFRSEIMDRPSTDGGGSEPRGKDAA